MNADGAPGGLIDDRQVAASGGAAELHQQFRSASLRKLEIHNQDPASARESADRVPKAAAQPGVGDEPLRGNAGLARPHHPSYSAGMTAAERLQTVRDGIAAAAKVARRDPADVTLVAVTKTRNVEQIEALAEAGQKDFGENRVQEAVAKWPDLLARRRGLRLHCIGRLQSNKAAEAVRLFRSIHSLDRRSLLDALVKEGAKAGRYPEVYVQVNIGDEPQKGGCPIAEVGDLVAAVRASPLPLAGLMCIPPLGLEPSPFFALLAKIAADHGVDGLSMGMSSDYRSAIMLGATAVRVGTALFDD